MEKKRLILGIASACLVCVLAALLLGGGTRPAMRWARDLKPADIAKIELIVMPSAENERYRRLDESEFPIIAALIRESRGRYLAEPEDLAGGSISLYITMRDGSAHTVINSGNTYLMIDGEHYLAGYRWLSKWDDVQYGLNKGNISLPEGFVF